LLISIPHFKPGCISSSGHSKEDEESVIIRQLQVFVKRSDVLLMSDEPGKSRLCQMGSTGSYPYFPIFPESQAERGGLAHFGVKMGKSFARFQPKTHVPKSENRKFAEIFIVYLTKI